MKGRSSPSVRAVRLVLLAIIGIVVLFPSAVGLLRIVQGLSADAPHLPSPDGVDLLSWSSLVSARVIVHTIAWAIGIGLCTTLLAWPAAWAIRRHGRAALPWIAIPMCMPSYLAYAGYGLARAPGTWLGDRLEHLAHEGWPDAPVLVGKVLAFLGLCLYMWPVASLILGLSATRIDDHILESLRVDGAARARRQATLARIMLAPLVASIALIALLMLGSAIPTHLAQVDTWTIKLWFALDNTPTAARWRIWLLASPVILLGVLAAWRLAGRARRGWDHAGIDTPSVRPARASVALTVVLWLAGTIVPITLFALAIRAPSALIGFWRVNDDAAGWSALVAGVTAGIGVFICAACWLIGSTHRATGLRPAVAMLAAAGLAPGVILGSIINDAWSSWEQTRPLADSYWIVVLAHTARFAWMPALVGCWLSAIEPAQRRSQRRIDGAESLSGWWLACARPSLLPALLTGVFVGLMSLHEIESTVMVEPPGVDNLARRILQFLHFSRMDDLSAAGVWLIGGGLLIASFAAAVDWFYLPFHARHPAETTRSGNRM